MPLKNTIIYLFGFSGVGKLTIAKELEKLDEFRLVHNQLINNPLMCVMEKVDGRVPEYVWENARKIRDIVFETIKKNSPAHLNFIFTNELIEGNTDCLKIYNKVAEVGVARGSKFVPVRITVSENEHRKRLGSEDRKANFKVTDAAYVDRISGKEVLKIEHKNLIDIDITEMSAQEVAKHILNKIKELN